MRACALALSVAAPAALPAQRIAPGIVWTSALHLRMASFASLAADTLTAHVALPRLPLRTKPAPPALAQADSVIASDTHAQTGAIIGGVVGAVAGGLAAAKFTHRAGATNSTTGTVGGAVVGAGLIGTLGALAGLVIGSAIKD